MIKAHRGGRAAAGTRARGPECRGCGDAATLPLLSLGDVPLANSLLEHAQLDDDEARYPLDLVFCSRCALVQITESVEPATLFRHYRYYSSVSDTVVENARRLSERLVAERGLGPSHLVVEIASNDGYLLRNYVAAGVPVLGIEPAVNIAESANAAGIPTLVEFFGRSLAERLHADGLRADVIHANNVLAHVRDLNGVVSGMEHVLAPGGVILVEVPYVRDLIENGAFDTIYHEHLCYFSLTALSRIADRHGLVIADVERLPIHAGSLRVTLARRADGVMPSNAVRTLLQQERRDRMDGVEYYRGFARRVETVRDELLRMLRSLVTDGHRIAAYGAAAKGSTLLNYCGIGTDLIDFVVDRSPHKQGRFMAGCRLLVFPPERLLESQPDFVLLLSWNHADEIMAQQHEYLVRGGRFIVPVPRPAIITSESRRCA